MGGAKRGVCGGAKRGVCGSDSQLNILEEFVQG